MVKLLITVLIFALTVCSAAGQCTLNQYRATEITQQLVNPDGKLTFDDLFLSGSIVEVPNTDSITWSIGNQNFALSGFFCGITTNSYPLSQGGSWAGGTSTWDGESDTVGYYIFTESTDSVCTITFFPPIAEFSMRVNTDSNNLGVLQVTTADNFLATCKILEAVTGTNTWQYVGFRGMRQIKSITLQAGYVVGDNIEWKQAGCTYGQTWNGQDCEGKQILSGCSQRLKIFRPGRMLARILQLQRCVPRNSARSDMHMPQHIRR
jgi:hypothetical protein